MKKMVYTNKIDDEGISKNRESVENTALQGAFLIF